MVAKFWYYQCHGSTSNKYCSSATPESSRSSKYGCNTLLPSLSTHSYVCRCSAGAWMMMTLKSVKWPRCMAWFSTYPPEHSILTPFYSTLSGILHPSPHRSLLTLRAGCLLSMCLSHWLSVLSALPTGLVSQPPEMLTPSESPVAPRTTWWYASGMLRSSGSACSSTATRTQSSAGCQSY